MPRWAAPSAPAIRARFPDRSASASDSVGPPRPRRVALVLQCCCGGCCGAPRERDDGHSCEALRSEELSEMPRNRSRRRRSASTRTMSARKATPPELSNHAVRPASRTVPRAPAASRVPFRGGTLGFFESSPFPRWRRRPRAGQHRRHIVTSRSSHAPAPKPFAGGRSAERASSRHYKSGVSELGHCVPRGRRLPSWLTEGQPRMTSVLRTLPLSYAMLSEGRRGGSASAVHEPRSTYLAYGASSIAPAGPSARATLPRRSPGSSTPRVRLHLKPGQKGTKQLLAQYGARLVCVRYRYDAEQKKR
jgi:hypothetical protein